MDDDVTDSHIFQHEYLVVLQTSTNKKAKRQSIDKVGCWLVTKQQKQDQSTPLSIMSGASALNSTLEDMHMTENKSTFLT